LTGRGNSMGWSLEIFLKQFVLLDWITKEQSIYIREKMTVPMCSLLVKLDHKMRIDESRIKNLESKLSLLKDGLESIDRLSRSHESCELLYINDITNNCLKKMEE
jgi:hypothetical protein